MKGTSDMNKQWTDKQVSQHKTAADLLCKIMDRAFDFIRQNQNVTEYEVQQFIRSKYKQYDMVEDVDPPIVAFRENTSFVHYFPTEKTAKKLMDNTLIMIDIWARLNEPNAPFADITWMAWHGDKVPADIQEGFDTILKSRDVGMDFIREKLAAGQVISNKELGKATEDITLASDIQDLVPHAYGHSLGTISCHGNLGVIHGKSTTDLIKQVGYTMEPGIYVEGKYGFRSEVDFLVTENGKLDITTKVQTELEIV
jgi:Xaa-Pro aminopeptidase